MMLTLNNIQHINLLFFKNFFICLEASRKPTIASFAKIVMFDVDFQIVDVWLISKYAFLQRCRKTLPYIYDGTF